VPQRNRSALDCDVESLHWLLFHSHSRTVPGTDTVW
jgi:hypothetical protein